MITTGLFWMAAFLAFLFGMTNGFLVGGSLLSAVIMTRVLRPFSALICVAVCEVIGVFLLGQEVARTMGPRLVAVPPAGSESLLLSALIAALSGALLWNLVMWRLALPSSSGHAIVGALTGAFLGAYGFQSIHWPVFLRILSVLVVLPVLGTALGYVLSCAGYWVGEFLTPAWGRLFRALQIGALAGAALVHGSNDGQKPMAILFLALAGHQAAQRQAPLGWPAVLLCGIALALGLVLGSRRIIKSMGEGLFTVQPLQGVCAQTSTILLVGASSVAGYPMSSSQLMASSLLGAGMAVRPRRIRWDLAGGIGLAWLITLPTAGVLAAGFACLAREFSHVVS